MPVKKSCIFIVLATADIFHQSYSTFAHFLSPILSRPQLILYFFPYFIIIPPHCVFIHSHFSCNQALIGDFRMLAHIGCNQLFLLADAFRDGGQVAALLDSLDLRLHFCNQSRQEGLTLLPRLGIHIPGNASCRPAIRENIDLPKGVR